MEKSNYKRGSDNIRTREGKKRLSLRTALIYKNLFR